MRTGQGLRRHPRDLAGLDDIDEGLVHHALRHGVGIDAALSHHGPFFILEEAVYDAYSFVLLASRARMTAVALDLLESAVGARTAFLVLDLRNDNRHLDVF